MENANKYLTQLKSLHCSNVGGFKAPHKAILMISIAEMIRDGQILFPTIHLNDELSSKFQSNWYKYIQIQTPFVCNIYTPLKYIASEKFVISISADILEIDKDLFELFRNPLTSERIITEMVSKYLVSFANVHRIKFQELDPCRDKTLRDYQIDAKKQIYRKWSQMRSLMLQMPTGTGKTKLFVSIARDLVDWGAQRKMAVKILFLAHRIELIDQISENLGVKYKLAHGMIVSQNREQKYMPVQIGSVPTLVRRLDNWIDKDFDVVIIDEAHHVKADSYKKILKAFPKAKVLGVTATPYRMNGASFRPEFDDLIISASVGKFIKQHWLCDYDYYSIRPDSPIQVDINNIRQFALDGDYLDAAMLDVMDKAEIRAGVVSSYERYAKGKKGIVYTINQMHNEHVCERYCEKGYKAVAIDAQTPAEKRKKIVADFKAGKIDIICNVNIFSEGFDCPDVEFIQLARPTKSLSMFLQQIGRGLRPAEGKQKLLIIDNVGLYNRFGFPSADRKWKYHFEGHFFNGGLEERFEGNDGHEVYFMDDYTEGDEELEMIHSSEDEVEQEDETVDSVPDESFDDIPVDVLPAEYIYERKFALYLNSQGFSEAEINRTIFVIKNEIDTIILRKYDSGFSSVLSIDDIEVIDIYLNEFQITPFMRDLNESRHHSMSQALKHYKNFLQNGNDLSEETVEEEETEN